jgi:hypothetical protein
MVRLKFDRHRRLNKRLFPILPNLVHFSPQTIEIRVNYGLGTSAFSEFDSDGRNVIGVDRDNFYG